MLPKTLLVTALAALVAFVLLNLETWRTGRVHTEPLNLVHGGPTVAPAGRLWIDTDAACGVPGRTDPDDCLAIAWLAAQGDEIAGISSSFGNAPGDVVADTAAALARTLAEAGKPVPRPVVGAAVPLGPGAPDPPAVEALRTALAEDPLTILALGPLTNVAAALEGRPDLQEAVTRIVAVMGRRRGHLFHPSEGRGEHPLLGHGPIFRDLNLAVDPEAAREVLAMDVPLTLVPYDAARRVEITGEDIDRLARAAPAFAAAPEWTRDWLAFWDETVGLPGFYPFDWMAAAYVRDPGRFDCAPVRAEVAREWVFGVMPRQGLFVSGAPLERTPPVLYCPRADPGLHDILTRPGDVASRP